MKKSLFISLVLLASMLTACSMAEIDHLFKKSGDVLFADDFSLPGNNRWVTLLDERGFMDYYNTGFRMWINTPGYNFLSTTREIYKNVKIDVDAARIDGPENNRFGVICRFQDVNNYYFFIISSDGYFGIGKVVEGITTHLGQEMMLSNPSIQPGVAPNHLQAECNDDLLTFYINGQPAGIAQADDFSTGEVGLLAGAFDEVGVDILFDNFKIVKP